MSNLKVQGNASGSGTTTFQSADTNDSITWSLPPTASSSTVGYLNIPQSGAEKTTSYTLATTDVGQMVVVGSGGSVTVPNSTFAAGDAIVIVNNTSGSITLTMSITTSYIAGVNTDDDSISVATRGIANILFLSGTVCIVTGNVS